MARHSDKTPGKTKAEKDGKKDGAAPAVFLVPQAHGGALVSGGTPGQKGGTGRPKSEVRAAYLASFDKRIVILEQIADDPNNSAKDRMDAVIALGKFSVGMMSESKQDVVTEQRVSAVHLRREA